jgi:trehalose 6-phosphate synthase
VPTENPLHQDVDLKQSPAISLFDSVRRVAQETKVIIVSNREPVIHEQTARGIRAVRPASGLVTGLEPIVKAVSGTWIAHGSGSADRKTVDKHDRVIIGGQESPYTLRRVWLTRQEESGYYYGLSNSALWPLCHQAYTRPQFNRSDWELYRIVNAKFCDAVLAEVGTGKAIVCIQDYHLALLPRLLKMQRPDLTVISFWHIPWPNRETFRIMPWGVELLDGLLGADVLGFHIQHHCNNFMDTVDRGIEARVDYEHFQIFRNDHPTWVRPFPISIDFSRISSDSAAPEIESRMKELSQEWLQTMLPQKVIVGVDRIDYTKGILERLRAFDKLLVHRPEYRGKVTFLNFSAPSRMHVDAYRDLNDRIDELVDNINWRHQTDDWVPVRFIREHHDYTTVLAAYRLADVLLVSSLHDGMNLVAKEFVAARTDCLGSLILSPYTGAARELISALLVNPYDTDSLADAMCQALEMSPSEMRHRMTHLREVVQANDIYHWGSALFDSVRAYSARNMSQ